MITFFEGFNNRLKTRLMYAYNPDFKPQPAMGDKPTDLTKRYYGNADAIGDYTERGTWHGTHGGSIIAADRTNRRKGYCRSCTAYESGCGS